MFTVFWLWVAAYKQVQGRIQELIDKGRGRVYIKGVWGPQGIYFHTMKQLLMQSAGGKKLRMAVISTEIHDYVL